MTEMLSRLMILQNQSGINEASIHFDLSMIRFFKINVLFLISNAIDEE